MNRHQIRWFERLFVCCLALPMLIVFPYLAHVNNPNENVRTYMTMSIVEQGTFRIDAIMARHGWIDDIAHTVGKHGEKTGVTSVKAPGNSYTGVPFYFLYRHLAPLFGQTFPTPASPPDVRESWLRNATWFLRLCTVTIPSLLFLLWFYRYLRAFSPDPRLRALAVAACGYGSNFFAYSTMFVSHALAGVAAFWAFGLAEQALRRHPNQPNNVIASMPSRLDFARRGSPHSNTMGSH